MRTRIGICDLAVQPLAFGVVRIFDGDRVIGYAQRAVTTGAVTIGHRLVLELDAGGHDPSDVGLAIDRAVPREPLPTSPYAEPWTVHQSAADSLALIERLKRRGQRAAA